MIILKNSYKTELSEKKLFERLKSIKEEEYGFSILKTKKFYVEYDNENFRIRKKRTNKQQPFHAQIIGEINLNNKSLEIKIRQSIYGTVFFSFFWIGLILTPFFSENYFEALGFSLIFLIILIPLTYYALINSVYLNKKWIEEELKLTKTDNQH